MKRYFVLIAFAIISLILFRTFLTNYFFQDDFFVFTITNVSGVKEIAEFFIPRTDVQFYRPLSHQLFFYISRTLFGWNSMYFHLEVFGMFCALIVSTYYTIGLFIKNISVRYIGVFLFATSAIHYNSLHWLANTSYIMVAFFFFIGIWVYVKKPSVLLTWLIFLLGLLSNEFMITLPLICIAYSLTQNKNKIVNNRDKLVVLLATTIIYAIIRFFIFHPNVGSYTYVFDKHAISSYRWFVLFFLNWPETIKDQMTNFYTIRPEFIKEFLKEVIFFVLNSIVIFVCFICIPIFIIIRRHKESQFVNENKKLLIFLASWFLITLLPIVFVPHHVSPHQGSISLLSFIIALLIPFDYIYSKKDIKLISLILLGSGVWVISSSMNIDLNNRIHWIKRRADIAQVWISRVQKKKSEITSYSQIIIGEDNKDVRVALSEKQGIREFLNEKNVEVIYSNLNKYKGKVTVINPNLIKDN